MRSPPTHMVQCPDRVPTNTSDEVPGQMARSCLKMGLDGQEVVCDSAEDGSLHKEKEARGVGEWVSRPRYQPAIIGTTQALIGVHGPPMLPVKRPVHLKTSRLPASQGL